MRILQLLTVITSVLTVGILSFAQPVFGDTANPTSSTNVVTINKGQNLHDLMVIGKDLNIAGNVQDNLVAIDCNVRIEAGGHVDTLLAIGGKVTKSQQASVRNALLFTPAGGILNHLALGIAFVSLASLLKFAASVFLVFSSVAFSVLLKSWLHKPLSLLGRSVRKMFAIGIVASLGILAFIVGFGATGIGLPVAVILTLLYGILGLIGIAYISVFLGRMILHPYRADAHVSVLALTGSILIVAGSNIPVVGILLFAVAWCTGTSTFIMSLRRQPDRS
ncbi:hypothetical protein [Alicyclobacillus dauci]|uniref:Uncharacterized protein n=1 Tax=Alicyclobacillus dauci TaxID=1475485 RepID=A0ABY6Z6X9_9BACL|nr:hypothetical protein [Alicyclobacillus dauci]WAH38362.1 hypothetical protein NZD86_07760 [Alicyclobacillus dauci]